MSLSLKDIDLLRISPGDIVVIARPITEDEKKDLVRVFSSSPVRPLAISFGPLELAREEEMNAAGVVSQGHTTMNLALPIPLPWRILMLLALCAAMFGTGYVKGLQHAADAATKADNRALQTVIKIERKQTAISASAAEHEETRAAARIVYRTIDKEVIKYVQASSPAARCQLDAGWVRLHDAAALARVPGAPGESDAAPSGITASDGIATVSSNYETCNDTRTQLIDLQAWVRKQQELSDAQAR